MLYRIILSSGFRAASEEAPRRAAPSAAAPSASRRGSRAEHPRAYAYASVAHPVRPRASHRLREEIRFGGGVVLDEVTFRTSVLDRGAAGLWQVSLTKIFPAKNFQGLI